MMMTLNDLINETITSSTVTSETRSATLLSILRKNHFWPALQMKRFFDKSGLVLLHNTYKRVDVDHFKDLYNECRSVVLDLDAAEGNNVIVNLTHSIPDRMTVEQYRQIKEDSDLCETAYEGTVVSVYHHNGKWYFGTTSCPNIDSSRFFHPTKTHGQMFDDVLQKMFPAVESDALRNEFTTHLDVNKAYAFVLVHHQNKHVVDYSAHFESAEYAELFHISSRDRINNEEVTLEDDALKSLGIKYSEKFDSPNDAISALNCGNLAMYGIIVKTHDNRLYKVSSDDVIRKEEFDLGNPNVWVNMLSVYVQTKPHFHVNDYIREYAPDLKFPVDHNGRDLAPTYIIHTAVCTMRDIIFHHYMLTTVYNPQVKRFRMNKEVDASLPPIMRFHLAQLRHLQVNDHSHGFLTPRAIYNYICHHQTLKNIRNLINFFATESDNFNMSANQAQCFKVLSDQLLMNATA